ncbi:hypothetical protein EAH75_04360 [Rhodanobacter glycinis]|uniref:hypothetical protein n=1 Tax=Rhodanobacter glycinis TaxID=582702 RepID=UPI00112A6899|nr:hypothetical protein [Rhodanobacter glycinis]TPG50678.1 hypothetical protein EAH75_04360 [Rhodanobacter glycinis]
MIAAAIVAVAAGLYWWRVVRPKLAVAKQQAVALAALQAASAAYDADVLAFGARERWEAAVRAAIGVAR